MIPPLYPILSIKTITLPATGMLWNAANPIVDTIWVIVRLKSKNEQEQFLKRISINQCFL